MSLFIDLTSHQRYGAYYQAHVCHTGFNSNYEIVLSLSSLVNHESTENDFLAERTKEALLVVLFMKLITADVAARVSTSAIAFLVSHTD